MPLLLELSMLLSPSYRFSSLIQRMQRWNRVASIQPLQRHDVGINQRKNTLKPSNYPQSIDWSQTSGFGKTSSWIRRNWSYLVIRSLLVRMLASGRHTLHRKDYDRHTPLCSRKAAYQWCKEGVSQIQSNPRLYLFQEQTRMTCVSIAIVSCQDILRQAYETYCWSMEKELFITTEMILATFGVICVFRPYSEFHRQPTDFLFSW